MNGENVDSQRVSLQDAFVSLMLGSKSSTGDGLVGGQPKVSNHKTYVKHEGLADFSGLINSFEDANIRSKCYKSPQKRT